jgi:hypothetical protein
VRYLSHNAANSRPDEHPPPLKGIPMKRTLIAVTVLAAAMSACSNSDTDTSADNGADDETTSSEPADSALPEPQPLVHNEAIYLAEMIPLETDLTDGNDPDEEFSFDPPPEFKPMSLRLCERMVGPNSELSIAYGERVVLREAVANRGYQTDQAGLNCLYDGGPQMIQFAFSEPFEGDLTFDGAASPWGNGFLDPDIGIASSLVIAPPDPQPLYQAIHQRIVDDIAAAQ